MDLQRFRNAPGIGLGVLGLVTVLAGYPWLVELATDESRLRPIALTIGAVTLVAAMAQWRLGRTFTDTIHLLLATALAAAAAVWQLHALLLVIPAFAFFGLAWLCLRSLKGTSVIEQMAKLIQPLAPTFIAPYCRRCTVCWAVLFLAYGAVQVILAATSNHDGWQLFSRRIGPLAIGAFLVAEYFVRKTYFRYYENRWFDRLLARAFPAERTEMGRRSKAYIEEVEARGLTGASPTSTQAQTSHG